jgi:hypothetical protein
LISWINPADRARAGKGTVDDANADQVGRGSRLPLGNLLRRLIVSIRDGDEQKVEAAILQLSKTRRIFAPLALLVGAFVMLFSALRLLVTNWRLMLVQVLPAMLIWAVTFDLKAHVLYGKEFHVIRGPLLLAVFAAVVLLTVAAFFLNAAFAFAISRPGPPQLRAGFALARSHATAVVCWGAGTGVVLGVAAVIATRWGLGWFTVLLGTVLGFMMFCYIAVPAHIVGAPTAKAAKATQSGRDRLAVTAVSGVFGAIVCAPPYVIARIGLVLLGSHALFWLGVTLLAIGLTLQAGATGAVKAIKVSTKLLAGQSRDAAPTR